MSRSSHILLATIALLLLFGAPAEAAKKIRVLHSTAVSAFLIAHKPILHLETACAAGSWKYAKPQLIRQWENDLPYTGRKRSSLWYCATAWMPEADVTAVAFMAIYRVRHYKHPYGGAVAKIKRTRPIRRVRETASGGWELY